MPTYSLITDSADVLRAPVATDTYGQQTRDWDNAQVVATVTCSIQPSTFDEDDTDRQTTTDDYAFYSQDAASWQIEATDRLAWQGIVLEVASNPQPWRFLAVNHHTEMRLKRVTG